MKISEKLRQELTGLMAQAYQLRKQLDHVEDLVKNGQAMLTIAQKTESAKDEEFATLSAQADKAAKIAADIATEVAE
jgi:hypothetical protein